MYRQIKETFKVCNGSEIEFWYREDTNDYNTILSVTRDDEYRTSEMTYSPGDVFIDIGAHIGAWSALMEELVENAIVLAVEPLPENVELLRANTVSKIFPTAVAENSSDHLKIYYANDSEYGKHHRFVGSMIKWGKYSNSYYLAPTIGLDDILKHIKRCRVMKVDCEGGEYPFLYRASTGSLGKIDYIIGEYHNYDSAVCWERKDLLTLVKGLFDDITVEKESHSETNPFWLRNKRLRPDRGK